MGVAAVLRPWSGSNGVGFDDVDGGEGGGVEGGLEGGPEDGPEPVLWRFFFQFVGKMFDIGGVVILTMMATRIR